MQAVITWRLPTGHLKLGQIVELTGAQMDASQFLLGEGWPAGMYAETDVTKMVFGRTMNIWHPCAWMRLLDDPDLDGELKDDEKTKIRDEHFVLDKLLEIFE